MRCELIEKWVPYWSTQIYSDFTNSHLLFHNVVGDYYLGISHSIPTTLEGSEPTCVSASFGNLSIMRILQH